MAFEDFSDELVRRRPQGGLQPSGIRAGGPAPGTGYPGGGAGAPPPPPPPAPTAQPQPFDRTRFRDDWMGTGADRGRQDELLQQQGLSLDPAGRATLPTGEIIDLRIGAKAGGTQASWTNAGGFQNGIPVTGAGGGGGGAPGGPGGGGAGGGSWNSGPMRDAIMRLLQRGENPLSANDPTLRAQFDPISRTMQRGAQRAQEQAAERAAFQGQSFGGKGGPLSGEQTSIAERLGEQEGGLMADLVGRELQGRRGDVINALQLAEGQDRIALQQQLAAIDAEIRRSGITEGARQHDDRFGYDLSEAQYRRDRDAFGYGAGF